MRLIKGLADQKVLKNISRFNRLKNLGERGLGFYLLDFSQRGLFRKHGYSSIAHFVLIRLQIQSKKTREILRIARALEELPLIDEAFAQARISWSAVRELTRVAVRETEREWVELAEKSTLRQIERAVSAAAHGERPPRDPYGLSKTKFNINGALSVEDYAVWQAAFNRLMERQGSDLDVSGTLLFLSQFFLDSPLSKREKQSRQSFQVVYHRCSECDRAWIETDDGPQGIPVAKVAEREKHARVIHLPERGEERKVPAVAGAGSVVAIDKTVMSATLVQPLKNVAAAGGGDSLLAKGCGNSDAPRGASVQRLSCHQNAPRGARAERLSCHQNAPRGASVSTPQTPLVPLESRDKPNSSLIRQQVINRDGQSCAVPGCSNTGQLYAHHVQWKSHGGKTQISNEISVCARCHGLIHEGLLHVFGQAPHGLRWSGSKRKPLLGLDRPEKQQQSYIRAPKENAPRGASSNHDEERVDIYSLDEVPSDIDSAWWRKHKHNFVFKGNRIVLRSP